MNLQELQRQGVQYVRIIWTDNANVIRAKAAYTGSLAAALPSDVGIAAAQQALPVTADAVAPGAGLGPVGEVRLVPDWSTYRLLPYAPGQAAVLGDMMVNGRPWEHCPRAFLREQIASAAELGLNLSAAFENEFFLLRPHGDTYVPVDQTVFAHTAGFNQHAEFIRVLTSSLETQGLIPEYYYPESGPGQQELSIRYSGAAEAADQQVIFRETVRAVAQSMGLVASFLPKPFERAAGSGCHLNMSLWRNGQNLMGDPAHHTGIGAEGRQFIAGILAHLPALCALTIPSHNSYHRIKPHFWAGAYTAWGYENREASVRVSRSELGCSRFELKTVDASANPYLALGAVIAAGLDGIRRQLPLADEITTDPALLSATEQQRGGITLLPQSLNEAVEHLKKDDVLLTALGQARARAYIAVRLAEWEQLKDLSIPAELKLLAASY